jgi:hypothetical protein
MIPEYSTWVKCPFCNIKTEPNVDRSSEPHPMHGYRKTCAQCGRQIGWTGKPDKDKAKRPAAHRKLVKARGVDYCEICGINRSALPSEETLEGHHVVGYADGGDCEASNALTVCTACHILIHFRRTYVGHLIGKENQHHAERGTDTGDAQGTPAVGELETVGSRREADQSPDAADRDAGKLDGPSNVVDLRRCDSCDDSIPF